MSIFITIFSGVCVFVLGQVIVKLFIDPVHGYKASVGEVSTALINYTSSYANPGVGTKESMDEASKEIRLLASKLSAQVSMIPCYDKTAKVFFLPCKDNIYEAKTQLIGLSNGIHQADRGSRKVSLGEINMRKAEKICDLLGIYVPENERMYKDKNA